jgi:glucosamine-6-phosphate deaminase
MEVVIRRRERQCGVTAADIVADAVASGAAALGLATGSSPLSVYRELIRRHRKGTFAGVQAFLLDEYVGLPPGHPQPRRHGRGHLRCGTGVRRVDRRRRADRCSTPGHRRQRAHRIQRAGIVIGITHQGQDAHRADAARQRPVFREHQSSINELPRHIITQGLGTICEARHLVRIATGSHKAEAIAAAVEGPLAASCPASVLQPHPHVTAVIDEAAAGLLKNADFYRYALKHNPAQQQY